MIHQRDLEQKERIAHVADSTGKRYAIATQRLRNKLSSTDPELLLIDKDLVTVLMEKGKISTAYLAHLVSLQDKDFDKVPCPVAVRFKDQTWTFVENAEVYIASFIRLYSYASVYIASRQTWTPFIIKMEDQKIITHV